MSPAIDLQPREATWNSALLERYFSRDFSGRPVYLAVDWEELSSIANGIDSRPEELLQLVRTNLDERGDPYMTYKRRWNRWDSDRRSEPPYLTLLAVCVLAASDMGRDDSQGISANDFYTRLAERLDIDRARAVAEFGTLAGMWVSLGAWLERDQNGARGNPMIEEPEWFTNIGWPVSQSIFSAADRYRLPDCFAAAELNPGDQVSDEQLFEKVRRWASSGYRLTKRGTKMIVSASGNAELQLREIVSREFAEWDGTLRDSEGRRRGVIHLAMFSQAGTTHFEFRPARPLGFPDRFEQDFPAREVLESPIEGFYDALGTSVSEMSLKAGVRLQMPRFSLSFTPQPVIPLGESDEIEGWLSVPRVSADGPYAIVVNSDYLAHVTRYLSEAAVGSTPAPSRAKALPDGWTLFRNVMFKPDASTSVPELSCLVPRSDLTSQLIGGLKVRNAPPIYLAGCEPRLILSSAERAVDQVEIDGVYRNLDKGTLDLSTLGLDPGSHEVVAGDITRSFETVHSLEECSEQVIPTIGHRILMPRRRPLESGASLLPKNEREEGEHRVVGAYSEYDERPDLRPVFVRIGGSRYAAIGSKPGEYIEFDAHAYPEWLRAVEPPKRRRGADWQDLLERTRDFDVYLKFEPAWFISMNEKGRRLIPGSKAPASTELAGNTEELDSWCEAVLGVARPESENQVAIWNGYVKVAEGRVAAA